MKPQLLPSAPPSSARTPHYLESLSAVALARMTIEGRLLEANHGFRRLLQRPESEVVAGLDLRRHFVNPRFEDLLSLAVRGEPPRRFEGILTLGAGNAVCASLNAVVYQQGDELLLVGEHDIADIERLSAAVLEVNEQLAGTQRELSRRNRELQRAQARLEELARSDALTGVANRRYLDERLATEVERAERLGLTLSVVMADIDHFKDVNDRHGHAAGDAALKEFAQILRARLRPYDLVARYGGEEFLAVLPHTALSAAQEIAERMRATLAAEPRQGVPAVITASFGVAERSPGESGAQLLARADAALYAAKAQGRDRVALG